MIIWNSLKLFPHVHGYLFIFANTEIYVISTKLIELLSRRHLINSSDVFFIKGFTVGEMFAKINVQKMIKYTFLKRTWPCHSKYAKLLNMQNSSFLINLMCFYKNLKMCKYLLTGCMQKHFQKFLCKTCTLRFLMS